MPSYGIEWLDEAAADVRAIDRTTIAEIRARLAKSFKLTSKELSTKYKSGSTVSVNRVAWALSHLTRKKLVRSTAPGAYPNHRPRRRISQKQPVE